jgi:hypothetical protein
VVNDLLCMLEQPYLRRNFVDDIVRLLLDIVKDTKSQVRQCQPSPEHCQGYQEPSTTLSAYSWTLSRIRRARYDIVRLLLDIVKDTKSQVQPVLFWAFWIRSRIFIKVRIRILLSSSYKNKKNLDSYCFVISL